MVTLRLDSKLEKSINDSARLLGVSKSELIRKSIEEYLKKFDTQPNAWEIGKDLFGKYASGVNNLSKDRKVLFKKRLRPKENE